MSYLLVISLLTLMLVKQNDADDGGFDPATHLFTSATSRSKLDCTDAEFVDIIHTDAGVIDHLLREKCFEELGCFSALSPFFDIVERPISLLPEDREHINTHFLLYTPDEPDVPQNFSNIRKDVSNILKSSFNPSASTKFVVPGYISGNAAEWIKVLVDTLLRYSESNVFLVDWTRGNGPIYEQAVANTRVVGAEIALFIQRLQSVVDLKPEDVHILGHSLGSHIAGYAGKRLEKLGRITGLDPAGPYFMKVDPIVRLDRNDALLVDAIHTNAAPSRFQGFGLTESIGHFDYYPNGGHLQPGCKDMAHPLLSILSFLKHPSFDPKGLSDILLCNHQRAIYLFISSIPNRNCELLGTVCNSWKEYASGNCGTCEKAKENHCTPLGMHVNPFVSMIKKDQSINQDNHCIPLGMQVDHFVSMIKKDQSINLFLNTTATEPFCL